MSPRTIGIASLVLALWALPAAAQTAEAPQRMTVNDCVALAIRQNPEVLTGTAEIEEAEARKGGAAGMFGPKLHVDANVTEWNGKFAIGFALPGLPPGSAFPVHDALTWGASATLTQPITALLPIFDNYKLQDLGVDVATVRREAIKRDIAYRVTEVYYRLLQTMRLSEVAVASVDNLDAQLKQARTFYTNGVVGQNDVLRAEVAVANAKQRVIQLRGQINIARGRLATLLGLPADALIDPQPLAGDPPPRDASTIEDAERRAVSGRVELRELDKRIEQASHAVRYARAKLLPQVNAVGSYQHSEGFAFAQMNAAYVGATASWDVWDWGTTTSGISEAKAKTRQAMLARTKLEESVRLEARQAYVDVATAAEAMTVAKSALASAEENYRLVTKRYEANAATSFDVVDAEALLTQARGQMQTSLYDYIIARAALDRATGGSPSAR
jgi:outer membrane protein TolC